MLQKLQLFFCRIILCPTYSKCGLDEIDTARKMGMKIELDQDRVKEKMEWNRMRAQMSQSAQVAYCSFYSLVNK